MCFLTLRYIGTSATTLTGMTLLARMAPHAFFIAGCGSETLYVIQFDLKDASTIDSLRCLAWVEILLSGLVLEGQPDLISICVDVRLEVDMPSRELL